MEPSPVFSLSNCRLEHVPVIKTRQKREAELKAIRAEDDGVEQLVAILKGHLRMRPNQALPVQTLLIHDILAFEYPEAVIAQAPTPHVASARQLPVR